jgi:flagellar hook-associated protein 3 FlgL
LIAARAGTLSPDLLAGAARDALRALVGALGTSFQGEHVFGGVNTGSPPLSDYFDPSGSAARSAVADAFSATFGVSQDDPAVASLSAASVRGFLDGAFTSLFDDAGWTADWSQAADEPLRSAINLGETADVSASANEPALRKLAMAYTMLADLGAQGMSPEAYGAVLDKATEVMGEAIPGLSALQAKLGAVQARVRDANDALTAQKIILTKATGALIDVDPYATATRVNDLKTQLETAYALTGRLQDLSLVKFL